MIQQVAAQPGCVLMESGPARQAAAQLGGPLVEFGCN